ncbi:MAG TPA: ABC transporter ATP-binding protein [Chthoniobacterales bacterium]
MTNPSPTPLLEMRGICKQYGHVQANRNIDLAIAQGRIVGLLGENGSGKSTLMKVLFGMVRADAGTIMFRGKPLVNHRPREALAAGIGMIHQHFMLVEAMTVAENVMLGWKPAGRWLRRRTVARLLKEKSGHYGLDLDPDALVADLSFGRRQRVEIMKAILRGAKLLILDEPTSNLSPPEVTGLLAALRRLRNEGLGIIFISHKLGEVLEVCDDVVVLRAGEITGAGPAADATRASLARLMVGRELAPPAPPATSAPGAEVLQTVGLSVRDNLGVERLHQVGFNLCAGEILAIAGVDGNGQNELANVLAGVTPATSGRIVFQGADITRRSARARTAAGLAYIPVDRSSTSLVPGMTVAENLGMRDFERAPFRKGPWLDRKAFQREAATRVTAFQVRCTGPDALVQTLSGGNQQKLVIAREIGRQPKVLLAFQPTWGLDPGAAQYVLEQVLALRASGGAILFISSDLDEVLALGDRVGVMFDGRLLGPLPRGEFDRARLGFMMVGAEPGARSLPTETFQAAAGPSVP